MAQTWDAGAHNENYAGSDYSTSLRVSGTIPYGVTGAVIGLTAESQVTRPAHILHGIQVSAGRYRAVDLGEAQTGWYDAPDAMARYHVTRLDSRVIYSVESESGGESDIAQSGDIVRGTIFHEADYIGPDQAEGAASLLSPGDSIINGEVVGLVHAGIEAIMEPMEIVASPEIAAKAAFMPMEVMAGVHRSGSVEASFQPLEVDALLIHEGVTFATVQFEPIQVSASMAGELSVGDGAAIVMEPMDMLASGYPWFEPTATVEFQPVAVAAYPEEYQGAYVSAEPMLAYSSGQRVPTGVRLGIILPAVTHENFLGTTVVEEVAAYSEIQHRSARLLSDTAIAYDEYRIFVSDNRSDTAFAYSEIQHSTVMLVESVATVSDEYTGESTQPGIEEIAVATDSISHHSNTGDDIVEQAVASDSTTGSTVSVVVEVAQAFDEAMASTAQTVEVSALAESMVEMVRLDDGATVEATAFAYDDIEHWRRSVMLVEEFATAIDDYFHYDPAAVAWVLNPETAALSQHTNYQITGAAGGYAVGPEGLFEMVGQTDNGDDIAAAITLPAVRLEKPDRGRVVRTDERKRIDRIWMDCESQTSMAIDLCSYDQGGAAFEYVAERPLQHLGNMTVPVGKGLKSKLFGITVRNTRGGDFALSSLSADVIETTRRR